MRRTTEQTDLQSVQARKQLEIQNQPYWYAFEKRGHLGYLKTDGYGIWISRFLRGRKDYADRRLGMSDDFEAADGIRILDFSQAISAARNWYAEQMIIEAALPIDDSPFNTAGPPCNRN